MSLVRTTTVNKMAFSAVAGLLNELININEWRKLIRFYSYQIQARLAGQQQTLGQSAHILELTKSVEPLVPRFSKSPPCCSARMRRSDAVSYHLSSYNSR